MKTTTIKTILMAATVAFWSSGCFLDGSTQQQTPEKHETVCDDGHDNDGDGWIDCQDNDCDGTAACVNPGQEICDNLIDDDGDGATDCEDTDCVTTRICECPKESCNNGHDDDGDGLIDCQDPDCADFLACLPVNEVCDNGQDDDGDGDRDCNDSDCEHHVACRPEDSCCAAHDTPGCHDYEIESCVCAQNAWCCEMEWDEVCVAMVSSLSCGECLPTTEVSCNNGTDDDGDGLLDCLDPDCDGNAECSCDSAHNSPGCGNSQIEACVCDYNCYCCEAQWDNVCAQQAQQLGCMEND